jgi:chemotaxis-related protein WspD
MTENQTTEILDNHELETESTEIVFVDKHSSNFHDCWNQIGVMGDRSCPKLTTVIHCYECPVYADVGNSLLEREPPEDYLSDWLNILQETSTTSHIGDDNEGIVPTAQSISMMIFRLGTEILSFPVSLLHEVTHPLVIQPLPHRSNQLFLGLVNIRGETLLCISLSNILNIEGTEEINIFQKTDSKQKALVEHKISQQRMIVAGHKEDKWVFPVDEVFGIFRVNLSELQDVPVVITKSEEGYTQGIFYWQGKKVNFLDSELLFYALNHKIL